MPYVVRRRLGVRVLTHPPLTRYLGPCIAPVEGKPPHRLSVEKDLMATLIRKLPDCHAFTPVPFDDDLARRIDRACTARDARTILAAVDAQDRIHAATWRAAGTSTSWGR